MKCNILILSVLAVFSSISDLNAANEEKAFIASREAQFQFRVESPQTEASVRFEAASDAIFAKDADKQDALQKIRNKTKSIFKFEPPMSCRVQTPSVQTARYSLDEREKKSGAVEEYVVIEFQLFCPAKISGHKMRVAIHKVLPKLKKVTLRFMNLDEPQVLEIKSDKTLLQIP